MTRPSWDDRYDREDYLYGTEPAAFVRREGGRIPPEARVLSVADGEGRNSVWLAQRGLSVTAFAASRRGLEKARALARANGVEVDFRQGDVQTWNWDAEPYDAVLAVFIQFVGPEARDRLFRDLDRALAPSGLLLLHGFAPRQVGYGTGGPPHRENMYTTDLLRAAFPGYLVLREADYDAHLDSGEGHSGTAALIDFVARKPPH